MGNRSDDGGHCLVSVNVAVVGRARGDVGERVREREGEITHIG